ncbi:MAG: hypothetical protein RLZZ610_923 [Actinomycetota bacterium]
MARGVTTLVLAITLVNSVGGTSSAVESKPVSRQELHSQVAALAQNPKSVVADNWRALSEPLELCALKESKNPFGGGAKGFPPKAWNSSTGQVKIAVIPVDFSNARGSGSPEALYRDDIRLMNRWAKHFSRGKMSYDIEFNAPKWIRAPKGAEWYTCTQCKGAKKELQPKQKAAQEIITVADKDYDFSGVEIVYFVFPAEAEEKWGTTLYGRNENYTTDEGMITASVYGEMGGVVGAKPDRRKIWDHAIHEFLHFQGFIGHGPSNHTGHFITVDQWGPSKAVTSWEAFLNGWFDEDEILCLDKRKLGSDVFVTMSSIDTFGPRKESVMIRLNDEEIIIVERREPGPFTRIDSSGSGGLRTGFTAYRVNVNGEHYRDDSDPTSDARNFWSFLGSRTNPTIVGSVEYKGVKISPMSTTRVKISRTAS